MIFDQNGAKNQIFANEKQLVSAVTDARHIYSKCVSGINKQHKLMLGKTQRKTHKVPGSLPLSCRFRFLCSSPRRVFSGEERGFISRISSGQCLIINVFILLPVIEPIRGVTLFSTISIAKYVRRLRNEKLQLVKGAVSRNSDKLGKYKMSVKLRQT